MSVRLTDTATRLLLMVVVTALIAGCDGATTDEPDLPDWATSLFADVEDLTTVESEEASVVFEYRGNASGMAGLIMDRLDQGNDFILHERLMVTGQTDDGRVQVVWTPANHDEFSGLGDGTWTVVATLTDTWDPTQITRSRAITHIPRNRAERHLLRGPVGGFRRRAQ